MSKTTTITKTQLVVERSDGDLWGRVKVKGNLIVEVAESVSELKKKIKQLVFESEGVTVEEFEVAYDLTSFFEEHSYLNISDVAKRAEINQALMRQYASGIKFPSEDRVKQIESAIREIGKELAKVKLHRPQKAAIA